LRVDCHVHNDLTYLGGLIKGGKKEDLRSMAKEFDLDKLCVSSVKAIEYDFVEGNTDTLRLMKALPELIWGYCVLHPRFGELATKEFDRCVVKGGMKGVKLYPVLPLWSADEASIDPVMEKIARSRVPALIHPTPVEPFFNLADRFPDATIILAHMGGGGGLQGIIGPIYDARKHDNVYLDTATSHFDAGMVEEAVKVVGPERVLYGSDFPLLEPNGQIQKVRSAKLREEEKRLIMGENMARLVGRRKV